MNLTRLLSAAAIAWIGCSTGAIAQQAAATVPPNIILILIDDMGWRDVGFAGNTFVETPNIDRLAREGVQFRQAYSNAPNCAPTRACLISGQYTPRHGVFSVVDDRHSPGKPHHKILSTPTKEALDGEVITIAETLKSRQYATACFGKWHLSVSKTGPSVPTSQGFDNYADAVDLGFERNGRFDKEGRYATDVLTDECLHFIEQNQKRPFFLYFTPHDVHAPHDPKKELVAKYREKATALGDTTSDPVYAAVTEGVDLSIGRLLSKLNDLNLSDNTVVVFVSDNGGTQKYVGPLRGSKGSLYEGGIRVPCAVWWSGIKNPGRVSDEPIASIDFYPTLAELAGAPLPKSQPLDGVSLVPILQNKPAISRDAIYWHFPCYIGGSGEPSSAIRMGDWKLIEKFADEKRELFNLKQDPNETTNLFEKELEKARELQTKLTNWQKSLNAPRPTTPNPAFDPNAQPAQRPPNRS